MTTTAIPHDAHGANEGCAACLIEGRPDWRVRYTEVDPAGPHVSGDVGGDNQISEAWGRRFYRELPDGEYAVIDVDFYVEQEGDKEDGGTRLAITRQMHFTRCTDLSDPGSSEVYADVAYVTEQTVQEPTEALAKGMCAEFDPAGLDWNGLPNGHRECHVVNSLDRPGMVRIECITHRPHFPLLRRYDWDAAASSVVCDKGEGWIFLVDTGTKDDPRPQLVSLAGLNEAVTRVMRARSDGQDYGTELHVSRYVGPGERVELAVALAPHVARRTSVPFERGPLLISRDYEVTGPREDGKPGRVLYLETTVTVNGDA